MSTKFLDAGQSRLEPVRLATARASADVSAEAKLNFDALYDAHFDIAWRTARRLGVPERSASDVVQDAFIVVHRRLADYDHRTPFKYWLLGIVTRVAADHRRSYARKDAHCVPPLVDQEGNDRMPSSAPSPYEQAEHAETLRLVVRLLDEIDDDKREVLVLAEFEEMTALEIASCLGLNVNTVSGRLRVARQEFDAAYARHRARERRGMP